MKLSFINAFLNEITARKEILSPAEILNELRTKIIKREFQEHIYKNWVLKFFFKIEKNFHENDRKVRGIF